MSSFAYVVLQPDGSRLRGTMQAPTYTEAVVQVRKLGGTAVDIRETADKRVSGVRAGAEKLSLRERIVFTEQLQVMLNAGVTLVQALKSLQQESTNKTLASVLSSIITEVEGGVPFSTALTKHPRVFSTIYCEMIRSAEKTGNLAEVLGKLTHQQQKEYELKGKVKGALMYPAIVSILLVAVVIMVITFILPKLSVMFVSSGVQLPATTRFLMALSDFLVNDWYVLIIAIIALIFGFQYSQRIPQIRYRWEDAKLRIPVLGNFMKKAVMARFCQSFASLAQAGVPVLEVFNTLKGVVGNPVYEQEIEAICKQVENGIKVSTAIRKSKYFPAMVGQLVSVGEQSGDLAGIFLVLGDFFEKEVDTLAKNLSTLLEPIIMIIMGVVIGFVLVAVLQPIYGLVNTV